MVEKKYAEIARAEVADAAKREREERARKQAELRACYEARKKELEGGEMRKIFDRDWKKQIDEAAKANKREADISITYGPSQTLSPGLEALSDVGRKFLENEGFRVKSYSDFHYSSGSDDPFGGYTFFGLKVSW